MTTGRDKLVGRVQKLLNRTTARGASEAEMAASVALAQRLMLKHNITDVDLDRRPAIAEAVAWSGKRLPHEVKVLGSFCAEYFAVSCIEQTRGRDRSVVLMGRGHDLAVASHVFAYVHRAGTLLWRSRRSEFRGVPKARYSFWVGLLVALGERITRERAEACRRTPGLQTALVRTHESLEREIAAQLPNIAPARPLSVPTDRGAVTAGVVAADGVRLRPAIGSEATHGARASC